MTLEPGDIFRIGNMAALGGWIFLVLAPRRWRLAFWVPKFLITGLLSAAYATLIATSFGKTEGGFGSLEQVKQLFANDHVLAAGWLHYLAFDLFVGCWIARQADAAGIHRLLQLPFLFLTFMFGPIGFLLFILTRAMMAPFSLRRVS